MDQFLKTAEELRFTWGKKPYSPAKRFTDQEVKRFAIENDYRNYEGGADPGRLEDAVSFTVSKNIKEEGEFTFPLLFPRVSHGVIGTFGRVVEDFLKENDKHITVTVEANLSREDLMKINVVSFQTKGNQLEMFSSITSEQLVKLAEDLEDPNNETLVAADHDEELLSRIAMSFSKAASALREAAEGIAVFEPTPDAITEEKLDEIAAIAEAFSESEDELLQKQASVLDDILVTLASPKNAGLFSIADHDDRIAELKKKYHETRESQLESNKVSEAVKEVEKSPVYKEYRTNEAPLSTRYCPDHPGESTHRIGEHSVRCGLDGKTYNWDEGYSTISGNKVPGGTVENQSSFDNGSHNFNSIDSRALRMGYNPGE